MISEELEVLKIVVERLDKCRIKYIVSGSIAMNFYAPPRMTRDIDIVVELPMSKAEDIYNLFKGDFYIDSGSVVEAINEKGMFNVIHNEKVIKIDFIIAKDTDYEKVKFQRRVLKDIEGVRLSIISVEDLVLSKLLWAKDSHSQLQFIDVKNIISFNRGGLNLDYLQKWADRLSVENFLKECAGA